MINEVKPYKYSIIQFISSLDYETPKEVIEKDPDCEYVLVTVDKRITSKTWKVIYDKELADMACSPIEKMYIFRFIKLFSYLTTDICVIITGAIEVKKPLTKLIDIFKDYEVCLMPHTVRSSIIDELRVWVISRGYPIENMNRFINMMKTSNFPFDYKGLFACTFLIERNDKICNDLRRMVFSFMKYLSPNNEIDRIDQTVYSYLIWYYFRGIKILPVSEQVIHSDYLQQYQHKSNVKHIGQIFNDLNKPDIKWMLNKQVECLYLK